MKKIISKSIYAILPTLLVALLVVLLMGCIPSGQNAQKTQVSKLDSILRAGVIRVGTTGDWIPMSVIDPATGEYSGRDIDIVTALANDMGVEIEFVKTDWKTLVTGIVSDRYDITTTASYNLARAKSVGYTLPFISVQTVAIVQKDMALDFSSWEDLNRADVSVAVTLGTVFDELVTKMLPNAKIIRVEPPAREYQEVLSQRAMASITDSVEARLLKKEHPESIDIIPGSFPYANLLGLLTPRDSQAFINYINVWITMKKAEGFFEALDKKWLDG